LYHLSFPLLVEVITARFRGDFTKYHTIRKEELNVCLKTDEKIT